MVAANIVGNAPVAFTDSTGAQRSVPLTAFAWDASGTPPLSLATTPVDWKTPAPIASADLAVIQSLMAARLATGEYAVAPLPALIPAIAFQAFTPGPDGNDITLSLNEPSQPNAPTSGVLDIGFTITLSIAHTYGPFSSLAAAATAIGLSAKAHPSPPSGAPDVGTGLVQIDTWPVPQTGIADQLAPKSVGNGLAIMAGNNKLFTLIPRPSVPQGDQTKIEVDTNSVGTPAFSIKVTYALPVTNPLKITYLAELAKLNPDLGFWVSALPPAGGYAVPALGPPQVKLVGGAPGTQASGFIYTK